MDVDGVPTRTIRAFPAQGYVEVIDQTWLPHELHWARLDDVGGAAEAIARMRVRGAPLIGVTAAYGMALAASAAADDAALDHAAALLVATRPTASNLAWAVRRVRSALDDVPPGGRAAAAWSLAAELAEQDVAANTAIGEHGLALLRDVCAPAVDAGRPLQLMTHCNAGWLATVDRGTALAPVWAAVEAGIDVHVWVSETRPRNQGLLTAWELAQHGVPHTVVADNAAGLLLARGRVDAVVVGADRVAANGDVANKVGTYLKALACNDNGVPFVVAVPGSTVDLDCPSGGAIPIEERDGDEVAVVRGVGDGGVPGRLRLLGAAAPVANPAFDVTPARLVTALVTDRGTCPARPQDLRRMFAQVPA